jgi:hypothetical protein
MDRVARFVNASPSLSDLKWLADAFGSWLKVDGDIPLERCLHLPTTQNAFRVMKRNQWICDAIALLPDRDLWVASTRLATEWNEFIARGPWRFWRGESDPPADASPLSRCLFYATSHNRGLAVGEKQISRIAGHLFSQKCP